jgi:FAD/FMN-containing dehydrogenase
VIPTEALARALEAAVGSSDQVRIRALDRYALANDASHYLLVPQAVVVANEAAAVGRLLRVSAAHGVPLTFRSGGTSLSGQAVGGGILVDTRRGFRDVEVLDDGKRVRVQPGITVRQLNARLVPFGRKFGIGSEGTLGFIAEAVFRTIPVLPHAATGLLVFDDLLAATGALPDLVATGAATIELLDAASLRVAQADPKADASLRAIDVRSHAALLVEYQAGTSDELAATRAGGAAVLAGLPLSVPAMLTSDPAIRARQWHVRKGLYAAIAGARPQGTTALLEDVVVPVDALARTCASLTELFDRYGYGGSVIFGHAKDGNVHFMLTDRFDLPEPQDRYIRFTEDMVDLVLGEGGDA